MPNQVVTTQMSAEDIVAAVRANGHASVVSFLALELTNKFERMTVTFGYEKMSQNIAQRLEVNQGQSKTSRQHTNASRSNGSLGNGMVEVRNLDVQSHNACGLGNFEPRQPMETDWRTVSPDFSTQKLEIFALDRQSVEADRVEKTDSYSLTVVDDLDEETQSLFALTENTIDSRLLPLFNVGHTSPLVLWISQASNDKMPMAERLEKSKWETRRLEKL